MSEAEEHRKLTPDSAETERPPEAVEPNPYSHPMGYFDAQVQFAEKWSEITGEDATKTLLEKTALYRRIWQQKAPLDRVPENWTGLLDGLGKDAKNKDVTSLLYGAYIAQPHSAYTPPVHTGAFGYDYLADKHIVKIHFTNPERGESPFSEENMQKRRQEFKQKLEAVLVDHPDAETLMSASWIRSTSSYRSMSPPDIAEQQSLMAPDMAFGGDSLWGQFIDKNGNTNQRVYDQFINAIGRAHSVDDLLAAFPYKVLKAEDPISKYYEYYGVDVPGVPLQQ